MSRQYDLYLEEHKGNVKKGFDWIKENLPELIIPIDGMDYEHQIGFEHDASKSDPEEYEAYDAYFYGGNRSYEVVQDFRYAWLRHIHLNKHHWQHWILSNDDPEEGEIVLDMPYNYILEMICDWWAFSWNSGNLREIFGWYDKHKDYMKLSDKTRKIVEDILGKIKEKLETVGWVKGALPTKSGNYAVRYNGIEGRDDFTIVGNNWWNAGDSKHPEEVEWKPDSFRELGL